MSAPPESDQPAVGCLRVFPPDLDAVEYPIVEGGVS